MLRITTVTLAILSGLAMASPAQASNSDLDITINVVGPHQNIQGTIENHIKIPENHDHQLINQADNAGAESHDHEGMSEQSSEASQQSQEQQQIQQDAQNASEQDQPDN
ncbi:hypothetical protein [Acidihalobacter prosperus]